MPTATRSAPAAASSAVATRGSDDVREAAKKQIVIRGARQHNLKELDLEIDRQQLVFVTGPSGSGKSSLAFDTIYAEGQRRYVESLSAYARQFLDRMDKPDVDLISGLAPAIAIEQNAPGRNPRSTVATQTEIYDHLRLLFARIGTTISPESGEAVTKDSPRSVAEALHARLDDGARFYLCFPIPEKRDLALRDQLTALREKGFFRVLLLPTEKQAERGEEAEVLDLNDTPPDKAKNYGRDRLLALVDRLIVRAGDADNQTRIADSVEQAFTEGDGRCTAVPARRGEARLTPQHQFSNRFERDGIVFEEPTPHLFSFNSPYGACPTCEGFGRMPGIDEKLVVPNESMSIRDGAIAPFRTDKWSTHFGDLVKVAEAESLDIDAPYRELEDWEKDIVWDGKGDYIGIHGFFDYLDSKSYKMHYRIFRARFRGYSPCPDCDGHRLRDEALYVKVGEGERQRHIGEVAAMTTEEARDYFDELTLSEYETQVAGRVLSEIRRRLRYLVEVGLDYLTLERLAQTLSGGEAQRINLATLLGSSLMGSLYVLDEPSVGLHPRDNDRLVTILENLRDKGNTVLVVEHEPAMIERADEVIDLGPGSGAGGGEIMFQGGVEHLLEDDDSLTGAYLSGREEIAVPDERRAACFDETITVENAREHNLKNLDVEFPLGAITCVTGVSGSGKSTLVHNTLYEGLRRLKTGESDGDLGAHDAVTGHERIDRAEMVDQSAVGRSPRSNPATYTNAFDGIRALLASTRQSQIRGYDAGTFSFNTKGGRCEECEGQGVVEVEMQFLADLYLECEACGGTRYKKEVLQVRYDGKNVDDILNMTIDEAAEFFADEVRVANRLTVLQDIGLGYLTLGQPSTTLSGGEAQRVKLAEHLGGRTKGDVLYLFDEPTTGLHPRDIQKLLDAFQQLIAEGHSVVIIEHNLDVIKSADHVIDLGPEGGQAGGEVVCAGTPEEIAACEEGHTGRFLREVL
jgi:excinuclease ABC subunit A